MTARLFSAAFGALMVAAASRPAGPLGLVVLALTAAALVAGLHFRAAAVPAVLLTVAGTALGEPVPILTAVSGLAAAAYLVSRYADDTATLTVPTVLGMLGFTCAGVAATVVPLQLSWVPLLAPVIIAGVLIMAAAPLVAEVFGNPADDHEPPG